MTREAKRAQSRSGIYQLLARLFRSEPDIDLIEALRNPSLLPVLPRAGLDLKRSRIYDSPPDRVVEDLSHEYVSLFVTPPERIALNESVHRQGEGMLLGGSTVRVQKLIGILGLSLDERWHGLPDHVSIEFEIMGRLTSAEVACRESGDGSRLDACLVKQRTFLAEHLEAWVPRLCEQIAARAGGGFYGQVARATRLFLDSERARLFASTD